MQLRLATLNVWALPEPLSVDPLRRVRAIGERLPSLSADVIAFQEVWFARARRILVEAGRRAGLSHAWSPEAQLGGSGLLVLSRLPIERAELSTFVLRGLPEQVTHGDYYGGKGYVRLRLATPAGPVSIVDTHLHAQYTAEASRAYVAHRAGQAVQLAVGTGAVEEPLIAAGDFNFIPGSDEHSVLTGLTGLRDLAHEVGGAEPTVLRSNPFRASSRKPDRRIDYVFVRDGSAAAVLARSAERIFAGRFGSERLAFSNHAGVLVELEIGTTNPAPRWQPNPGSIERALELLAAGRASAVQRQRERRAYTATGLGAAALVAVGDRRIRAGTSRRRFLRGGLQLAAAAALAPSVGCALLSEVFVPEEIRAYDRLARALETLRVAETLDRVETA
jgi:endonuclease/exonuclease/phosphatase family metal-dependent hydrolase